MTTENILNVSLMMDYNGSFVTLVLVLEVLTPVMLEKK